MATPDDVDAIVRLNAIVQGLHHRELPERFKPPEPDAYAVVVRALLTEDNRTWFLAELEGGEPVGYALAVRRERPESPSLGDWYSSNSNRSRSTLPLGARASARPSPEK